MWMCEFNMRKENNHRITRRQPTKGVRSGRPHLEPPKLKTKYGEVTFSKYELLYEILKVLEEIRDELKK